MGKYSILTWLITTYTAFIALWLISRVLIFDRFWPLALLNTIAEYLFLPLPLLIVLSILQKERELIIFLMIPMAAFIGLFGSLFWPSLNKSDQLQEGMPFTVMSFNVLHENHNYNAIVGSIKAASPDLIGFEELTPEIAHAIDQRLRTEYPYGTLQDLEEGRSAGILSRFPIETSEWFSLPPRDIALHNVVTIDERPVHVFVVHLSPNNFFDYPLAEVIPLVTERYGHRAVEVELLKTEIEALTEPVLLLCDCNMTDTSETYAHLNSFLDDSFREVGRGLGHTLHPPGLPFPVQRIDYVWHSNDFVALDAFVGRTGSGSDHLPIVAKLKLIEIP